MKVNVAKVNSVGEAADHEQLAAAGGVTAFEYAGETVKAVSSPFRLEGSPCAVERAPPRLDEHRDEILSEFGFSREEAADLASRGAFGSRETAAAD